MKKASKLSLGCAYCTMPNGKHEYECPYEKQRHKKKGLKKVSKLSKAKAKADPCSRYWRNKADAAWSKAVRADGRCLVCGSTEKLQAHHMIDRWVLPLRHELSNGVCLCPKHHKWDRRASAHRGPVGLIRVLVHECGPQWCWLNEQVRNWDEVVAREVDFKKAYERLVGLE